MKILLYTLPVAFLVACSQLLVKWRSSQLDFVSTTNNPTEGLWSYFSDIYIITAYFLALISSILWLIVISKIPLSTGFPIYIGSAFFMVMVGSFIFLNEPFSSVKLIAAVLIFAGIVLGSLD
ncbi:MAG: hypothetical protein CVU15_10610 [Betaproteobacteria bacterium HGW-Betaproteobacteria-1]|nr:MAG: hypothetical protein CVU15_10610 [Betaproteobacteria bacterium HGW-Betaproteobacteria-1]